MTLEASDMKVYKGENAIYFIVFIVVYNLIPLVFFMITDCFSNVWMIMIWIVYYSCDIFMLPVLIRNYIELYDDHFIFYYGFSKEKIQLKDILKMEKSRNPIASAANSLNRIHIITVKKDFYIALKENDEFIKDVFQRKQKL